jgi:hypothetical protein
VDRTWTSISDLSLPEIVPQHACWQACVDRWSPGGPVVSKDFIYGRGAHAIYPLLPVTSLYRDLLVHQYTEEQLQEFPELSVDRNVDR